MQGATYHCAKPQLISSSITPKRRTLPVLQFLCDQCKTILSVALDPERQAQVVAGQLRAVGEGSATSH